MIHLDSAVIVEGKYDLIKLRSILDATIIPTDGFGIFKDRDKLDLIRALAKKSGIILLTDSDAAGFKIRNFIKQAVREGEVRHVYIPDIYGKERRKEHPSKEGKLGVEGLDEATLLEVFSRAGITTQRKDRPGRKITKLDLYEDGLTGSMDSRAKRQALMLALELPVRLSANALLDVLNTLLDYDAYKRLVAGIRYYTE